MALDIDVLQQELQVIQQQREVVNENLRAFGPALRGRGGRGGRGGFAGRGPMGPPLAGRLEFRAPGPSPRDFRGPEGPGHSRDGHSRPLREGPDRPFRDGPERPFREGPRPSFRDAPGRDFRPEPLDQRRSSLMGEDRSHDSQAALSEAQPGAKRKLASAVVVADDIDAEAGGAAAKRPKQELVTELPSVKKRNQRMFGSLLGHLGKFREEDSKFKQSDAAQKRKEAMQQAELRKREEAAKARELAKLEMIAKRQAEIDKKRDLNAQADIKRLEIMVAQRIRHHVKLAQFLRTKAGPPLLWLPKTRLEATDALLEEQQTLLQLWQAQELERLEEEKLRILGRLQQPRPPALKSVVTIPAENGAQAEEEAEEEGNDGEDDGEAQADAEAVARETAEAAAAGPAAANGSAAPHAEDSGRYEPTRSPEPQAAEEQPVQEEPMEDDIDNPYED
ncbi:hypothetical protein WJX84_003918 [Apatococcus fuscideae]|uniref:Pinin/SDK/MemA protein domain-containing protein n=1 Tax=Apatococcus fuscideae TaxID=2026836 RepID=A0AAW1SVP8_9CHLO